MRIKGDAGHGVLLVADEDEVPGFQVGQHFG
jgi:hypothetical protein